MSIYRNPVSVKVCSYCNSQNVLDVSGFSSLRMDAWFCHKYCHNIALLTSGDVRQSDNPAYYNELIKSRKTIFPNKMIQRHRTWLREDVRNKRIKIIKHVFEKAEPYEDNRVE